MGRTKDLNRKARDLRLLERRLRRQRQLPVDADKQLLETAERKGYASGYKRGQVDGVAECLDSAKRFTSAASIRKSIGAINRRIKA